MHFGRKKSFMDRAHDYVESVAETVIPQLESALETTRDKAGPVLTEARDRAVPLVVDARDRAVPLLQDARDKAAPMLAEGRALAAEKAAAGAAVAADRASIARDAAAAKVAELRAEPEPQGGRLKKVLLLGGLLAVAGAVLAKLRRSQADSQNWQSSYTPPPAPAAPAATPPARPTPVAGDPLTDPLETDDVAGGAPGEALSDQAESPHEVTTPDAPADVVDVDDADATKK